ncbi:MAG TPA: hypothetical protein VER58_15945 [Thermoanaerobaculia bacterium]|nr:hypothetical protein [Thermoanaerobaculia bacterium]
MWKRVWLWNLPALTLSLVALTLFLSIQHPRTEQSKLFFASALLSILLAFNAVALLVFLRQRFVGLILTLLTGVSVFLLVEWFLKLQRVH